VDLGRFDLSIGQIIDAYPETREVFVNNGFPILTDDAILKQLGPVLKLKTALKSKNLNAEVFVRLLEERMAETGRYRELEATVMNSAGQMNMLTFLPCPLKVPLQSELQVLLECLRREKGLSLNYSIDTSANKLINYEDYIKYFEEPDEVPDLILTTGYDFFYKKFIERFIKTGVFARTSGQVVNSQLAEAGIIDPEGSFTVIAVNVLVMVVDTKRLGNLPMPKTWSDLLNPIYEQQVVMRGHGDIFCDIVQMNYFKEYGRQGIAGLAKAVRYGLHPAQMVKELISSRADVPPIHIMPRFFAETITDRRNIAVIWPEDGALAYPVSLLVKAAKMNELKELVDYLTGAHVAQICTDALFPATHPEVEQNLPPDAKFKWLGWDYVKSCDIEVLVEEVNRQFIQAHGEGGGSRCS
jgi:ABC-type Fe3+ transport system substrate-binding protein